MIFSATIPNVFSRTKEANVRILYPRETVCTVHPLASSFETLERSAGLGSMCFELDDLTIQSSLEYSAVQSGQLPSCLVAVNEAKKLEVICHSLVCSIKLIQTGVLGLTPHQHHGISPAQKKRTG